jgi:uncharacterized protein (DUF885 family)
VSRQFLVVLLCGLTSCAGRAPARSGPASSNEASAGIQDRALSTLLDEHWDWTMQTSPEWSTSLGDGRFDHLVTDRSVEAHKARKEELSTFLKSAHALEGHASLSDRDTMFLGLFVESLQADLRSSACQFETWSLSPRMNVMGDLQDALDVQDIATPNARQTYLLRLKAWAVAMDPHLATLRAGLTTGRVANATSLQLVEEMVQRQLDLPTAEWPLYRLPEEVSPAQLVYAEALSEAIDGSVRPALQRYADLLHTELIPAGRSDEAPGLASLDLGAACYAAQIQRFTSLPLTAEELHQRGLDELERIHAEFVQPGAEVFGLWDRELLFDRLRTDPALYFDAAEEIVDKAESALAAAQAAVPAVFGNLPSTPCIVSVIPEYSAPYTTIAYYRQPPADGSKPGEYFVNTYEPTTRPRHEAEVLAFHESVPGHHLQIALSYALPSVPAFHRYAGSTAFIEGWALYTERLADELSLYSGETDRLGMLSFDAWRAARLVVDTGLHHKGWSRAQAEQFMLENTPLPANNIRNEVDRYITWPGQALAYKIGQLEIFSLRAEAKAELADAFVLSHFHDVVLSQGAVSLPALRALVRRWIAAGGGPLTQAP